MTKTFITQPQIYAKFRPDYPAELFTRLADLCVEKNWAWDVGAGNGQAATDLANHFQSVIATDLDLQQLQQAKPHSQIYYCQSSAEQAPLLDHSMDLITVAQALHWFDFENFFGEVKRVLKPTGIFAAWTYSRCQLKPELDKILSHFYQHIVGPYWPAQRHWVDEDYATIPLPFDRMTTQQYRLEKHWSLPHFLGYIRSWSAVNHYQRQQGEDPVINLGKQLSEFWSDAEQPIHWVLTTKAGRKCKN